MVFPAFKYHPDPIGTGSIEVSDAECVCCQQRRGYVYVGPVYAIDELEASICPWCIADGSAHEKFDAAFTDAAGVCGYQRSITITDAVIEEVAYRTPGFAGWQQEHWLVCCGDAAAYLGPAGREELEHVWPDAIPSIQDECGLAGEEWEYYFNGMHKDGSPTAYIFQCLHCGRHLGYSDCH